MSPSSAQDRAAIPPRSDSPITVNACILIDERDVGGVCLNVGCIPSKTLIHQAELAYLATTANDTGVGVSIELDPIAMLTHRRKVIRDLTGGVQQLLASAGVETWAGTARFARVDRLAVEAEQGVRHLEFDHCVIATGSRPVVLPDLVTGDSGVEVSIRPERSSWTASRDRWWSSAGATSGWSSARRGPNSAAG